MGGQFSGNDEEDISIIEYLKSIMVMNIKHRQVREIIQRVRHLPCMQSYMAYMAIQTMPRVTFEHHTKSIF